MIEIFDMNVPGQRKKGLARAVAALEAGEVVAIPTETVYGLAADATNGHAVARIYEIKQRPRFNPLIVHVASRTAAEGLGLFDPIAERLAGAFWPGPLTLVLPMREGCGIAELVTAGLDTVAIRMPAHTVARAVLGAFQLPLAAPSANRSGRLSPTTAAHVAAELGDRVGVILNGGPAPIGIESTIVSTAGGKLVILRPGGIASEDIERIAGMNAERHDGVVRAPGMLASHYAPTAMLRLNAWSVRPGEAFLAFGNEKLPGAENAVAMRDLSPSGDLREAAARLFGSLRELDEAADVIAVAPIPDIGLGVAINDRLLRAAAPRA